MTMVTIIASCSANCQTKKSVWTSMLLDDYY